ncbi:MAG: LacI family DNA-binding transcriptional regulator [Eubacteriales bacterium]|nr:LacI family DNA-binding transcriptional regulator [Eubacteriales bacterium]
MISIREVAKLAGVSPATVSRVMNGTAKVDEEKRQRVLRVIHETGFTPNEVARSLYKKSSKIIGFLTPDIENPFFNQLTKAIEAEAYRRGYRLTLCNSNDDLEKEKENIQMLERMNADGVILITNNEKIQSEIERCRMPVVVLDRLLGQGEGFSYIQSDHYQGGRVATKHLIDCGCRKIVNIHGPQKYSSARERYRGYQDVCDELGITQYCVESQYNFKEGMKAAQNILDHYPDVDGIIACNDMVAISVYKVFSKAGIQIPSQVQLIGFDDIELSSLVTPELTTVAQPISDMGKKAIDLIISSIEGHPQKGEFTFPVRLIQRETTFYKR